MHWKGDAQPQDHQWSPSSFMSFRLGLALGWAVEYGDKISSVHSGDAGRARTPHPTPPQCGDESAVSSLIRMAHPLATASSSHPEPWTAELSGTRVSCLSWSWKWNGRSQWLWTGTKAVLCLLNLVSSALLGRHRKHLCSKKKPIWKMMVRGKILWKSCEVFKE